MLRHDSQNEIPMDKVIMIAHCMRCDTYKYDAFLEWLCILQAGEKVIISQDKPYLHLENVQHGLDCISCIKEEYYATVSIVIFEWMEKTTGD